MFMADLIPHLPLQEKIKQLWKIPAQGRNDEDNNIPNVHGGLIRHLPNKKRADPGSFH